MDLRFGEVGIYQIAYGGSKEEQVSVMVGRILKV